MGVDVSIQLNNHNSYKADETFWADPFPCALMDYVTASAALYASSPQADDDRLVMRFYDEDGDILRTDHFSFEVTPIWARVSATSAVPSGAVLGQLGFLAGSYWWAEAKTEEGELATAYAINATGQLTWITANGIYTGMVNASQVMAGQMTSIEGSMWINLNKPEIVMLGDDANLKISPSNPLRLEDKSGNLIGGLAGIDGELSLFADKLTNGPTADFYAKTGTFIYDGKTFHGVIGKKTGTATPMFSIGSSYNAIEEFGLDTPILTIRAQPTSMGGGVFVPTAGLQLQDKTEKASSSLRAYETSWSRIMMTPFLGTFVAGKSVLNLGDYFADSPPQKAELGVHGLDSDTIVHALGVDGTGPYYVINGVTKRLT